MQKRNVQEQFQFMSFITTSKVNWTERAALKQSFVVDDLSQYAMHPKECKNSMSNTITMIEL